MRKANYSIVQDMPEYLLILDEGPWDHFLTVTNAVERVISELLESGQLKAGQKLYYIDSFGDTDEIVVEDGKFLRFERGAPLLLGVYEPPPPQSAPPRDDNAFWNAFRKTNPNWRGD